MLYTFISKYRAALLVLLTHHLALPLLRIIRKPGRFPYSAEELSTFPVGTVGYDLYHFLHVKELYLLPHYARHDIKHILLNYDTTGEGEVCLQCFMLGNGHLSFPVLATVLYGFITMPEHWALFRKAWRRGLQAPPLSGWNWPALVTEQTQTLIEKINRNSNEKRND